MARFLILQLRAGSADAGPISGGTLAEMHTVQRLQNNWNDGIGTGWWIEPDTHVGDIVCHKGASRGFSSYVAFSKRYQIGVVILTNRKRSVEEVGRWALLTVAEALGPAEQPSAIEADRLYGWRSWSEAAAGYRGLVQETPSDGKAWFRLGSALGRMHQCAPAIEALIKATGLGESVPDSWFGVARCDLELGRDQDAPSPAEDRRRIRLRGR